MRDAYIPDSYLTIDRWASEDAFRAFRKDHDAEYEVLDRSVGLAYQPGDPHRRLYRFSWPLTWRLLHAEGNNPDSQASRNPAMV